VHHLGRELAIILGGLAGGQFYTLLAPAAPAARERVQRAQHDLSGAQVLGEVQARAGLGVSRTLLADIGGHDEDGYQEHEEEEPSPSAERYEYREVPAPTSAEASPASAEASPTSAAEPGAAAPAAGECR
jgi:hypothetical protein